VYPRTPQQLLPQQQGLASQYSPQVPTHARALCLSSGALNWLGTRACLVWHREAPGPQPPSLVSRAVRRPRRLWLACAITSRPLVLPVKCPRG